MNKAEKIEKLHRAINYQFEEFYRECYIDFYSVCDIGLDDEEEWEEMGARQSDILDKLDASLARIFENDKLVERHEWSEDE